MHKTISAIIATVTICFSSIPVHAAGSNAAPFGLELGVATLANVNKEIGAGSRLNNAGINKYTEGKMLVTKGEGLEIDGLQEALFVFDKSDKLAGVVLTLPKDPKSMFKTLSGKYIVKTNRIDNFMNKGYAQFTKGDSVIELDAPHLSFQMEVRYLTKDLLSAYNQATSNETATKEKRKANAL